MRNNISDETLRERCRKRLIPNAALFLVFFLTFLVRTLLKDGYAVNPATGVIFMEPMKYLHNLLTMWPLLIIFLAGVVLVLFGIGRTIFDRQYVKGIWPEGIGVILVVTVLLLIAGWNNTAFYPSNVDLQSSLTIANACSSEVTLRVMAWVTLLIPIIIAYGAYCWWSIDKTHLSKAEIEKGDAY